MLSGCKAMKDNKFRVHYRNSKRRAKERGIVFLLAFEEWLQIWTDSGHLAERGPKKYQHCMARFGDKGPYAVGNVKICTNEENQREAWEPLSRRLAQRERMVGNKRASRRFTPEERAARSAQAIRGWQARKLRLLAEMSVGF